MKTLSIVIPAYNEQATLGTLIRRILAVNLADLSFRKEIIVVDDGSRDNTGEIARSFAEAGVQYIHQNPNQGKGRAVRTGIEACSGDYVLVQDADLEYDPDDYRRMVQMLDGQTDCVYGSRVLGQLQANGWGLCPGKHPQQGYGPWLAGVVLSIWTLLLYRRWLSDTLTAYKLYPRTVLQNLSLETCGFETDHEITAKLIRRKCTIAEVPVSYYPRTAAEGKKIRARDGLIAIWTLLRYRFGSLSDRSLRTVGSAR